MQKSFLLSAVKQVRSQSNHAKVLLERERERERERNGMTSSKAVKNKKSFRKFDFFSFAA